MLNSYKTILHSNTIKMKKIISVQRASKLLSSILGLLIAFHLLVIVKVVPAHIIWGNQIPEANIMPLELIAIVISFSFLLFVQIKMRYVKMGQKNKVVNVLLWIVGAIFLFNAVMNLLSEVRAENFIFAPIALIMAFLTVRLAIEK